MLFPLLIVAFGLHLLTAVVNEGFFDNEEHYRYLELAGRSAEFGTVQDLPQDLVERRTPGLLPVLGHFAIRGGHALGIVSPFLQAALLRILSSMLGLLAALLMYSAFRGECSTRSARRWLFLLFLFLWFVPSLQARFSPENWSGMLFFMGVAWYHQRGEQGEASMMVAGFLLGLSFFARFHTAVMLIGFALWLVMVERADRRVVLSLLGGAAIAAVLAVLADRVFYGTWTLTPWNALASLGGDAGSVAPSALRAPWWSAIAEVLRRSFYPIGYLMVVLTGVFLTSARRHVITWVVAPYLLLYLLSPGEGIRTLFPLLLSLPVIMVLSTQMLLETIRNAEWRMRVTATMRWLGYGLWAMNIALLLAACVAPADTHAPLFRFMYDRYGGGETILLHAGADPYDEPGVPMVFYRPNLMQRYPLRASMRIDSIARSHPEARIILASAHTSYTVQFLSAGLSLRQVFKSVPTWKKLRDLGLWYANADTILLHEVVRNPSTASTQPVSVNGPRRAPFIRPAK